MKSGRKKKKKSLFLVGKGKGKYMVPYSAMCIFVISIFILNTDMQIRTDETMYLS